MNRKITIGVVVALLLVGGVVGYVSSCRHTAAMGLYVDDTRVEERDGGYSVAFEVRLAGTGSISFYGVSVVLYGVDGDQLAVRELGAFREPGNESVSLVVPERPYRISLTADRVERAPNTKGSIQGEVYENGEYTSADGRLIVSPWCRPLY